MAEVNLTLSIEKVSKSGNNDAPDNIKVLKIELSYPHNIESMNKFYEEIKPETILKEVNIGFINGAKDEIYNKLLDGKEKYLKLRWEKEKVDFWVEEGEHEEDNTKPRIHFLPSLKEMEIEIKPQFAEIIKINEDKDNPSPKISELEKEITSLQSRIRELENKKTQALDNSTDYQNYNQQIQQLKSELKEKEKEQHNKKPKGNEFPWKPVIIGGVIVGGVIIGLVIILLIKKIGKK